MAESTANQIAKIKRIGELLENSIIEQIGIIHMMGNEPATVQLTETGLEYLKAYWDEQITKTHGAKFEMAVATFQGLPIVTVSGELHLSGGFGSPGGLIFPAIVTSKASQ